MTWAWLLLLPLAGPDDAACDRFVLVDPVAVTADTSCVAPAVRAGDTIAIGAGGLVVVRDREGQQEAVCVNRSKTAQSVTVGGQTPAGPAPCPSAACRKRQQLLTCTASPWSPPVATAAAAVVERAPVEGDEADVQQVLVSDFTSTDVPAGTVEILTTLTAVELARRDGFKVVTGDELEDLVAQAGEASARDCREEAGACLAEVAGALGARFMVSGRVAKAGRLLVVSVSLFDTDAAKAIGRAQFEAQNIVAARERLPLAVDNLLAPFLGTPTVEIPPPPVVRAAEDASSIWGAVLTGTGTAAGGVLCFALPSGLCMTASLLGGGVLASAYLLPAIPCTACACGPTLLGAALGDALFGFEIGWLRAWAAALTGAGVMGLAAFISAVLVGVFTLGGPIAVSLISGLTLQPNDPLLLLPALIGAPIALAIGVVGGTATAVGASALVFDLGVVVFEPDPDPLAAPDDASGEQARAWPDEMTPPALRVAAQRY
jgi:TolB-like protein